MRNRHFGVVVVVIVVVVVVVVVVAEGKGMGGEGMGDETGAFRGKYGGVNGNEGCDVTVMVCVRFEHRLNQTTDLNRGHLSPPPITVFCKIPSVCLQMESVCVTHVPFISDR